MGAIRRLPAEWEPQAGVIIAWPHAHTDWGSHLDAAHADYATFALALAHFVPLLILVPDKGCRHWVARLLGNKNSISFAVVDYDDTWTRDYAPVTVLDGDQPRLLDFQFNGWGGKFDAHRDNRVSHALHEAGLFGETPLETIDFVLEGGSLDSDGAGTLLTTAACWQARHPELTQAQVNQRLNHWLGTERVIHLQHGHLQGDDTDSHVDTLARFCNPDTIAFQSCDDPQDEHYDELSSLATELGELRTAHGDPYQLVPLPWPGAIRDDDGRRLPAGYANFLITNGGVLVPTCADLADEAALTCLRKVFPERIVIGISARALIWQNGSLHCASMQLHESVNLPEAISE